VAIVFHEVAHGLAAKALGDPTASEAKRLSLNPLRHVDPIGTIILPGMLALAKLPVFGWAKPVPVDKWRLRNPRGDDDRGGGGAGVEHCDGGAGAVVLGLMARLPGARDGALWLRESVDMLLAFIQINLFLALFNLLPIPPFDGSHIVEGVLPEKAAALYARVRRLGFVLVLVLLVVMPRVVPGFNLVDRFVGRLSTGLTVM
jgi:Zn-dependent protease